MTGVIDLPSGPARMAPHRGKKRRCGRDAYKAEQVEDAMNIGVISRCLSRLIFLTLVCTCLGGATALYAQTDSCDRPGGRRGDGDDLKCRMGILIEKSNTFLEKTKARTDEQCATGGGCERLK